MTLTLEIHDAVAVLRIDRPEVRNAIDLATIDRFAAAVAEIEDRVDPRAVVLTGTGARSFCAGSDLAAFADLADWRQGQLAAQRMRAVLERLASGRRPVVAAVNGDAFGGGCEILTACHLRLAAPHARFGFRQAKMGVVTSWGGGVRLLQQLARPHALHLLLTATTVDAAEAARLGLIHAVAGEGDDVLAAALDLARTVAGNVPSVVAGFLQIAAALDRDGHAEAVRLESQLSERCWNDEPFRRQVESWLARRAARKA